MVTLVTFTFQIWSGSLYNTLENKKAFTEYFQSKNDFLSLQLREDLILLQFFIFYTKFGEDF